MTFRSGRLWLILAGLVLIPAACGNPGDHLSFRAPAKYQSSKTVFGMAQIWSTRDNQEALMLMKLPVRMDPKKALTTAGVQNATIKSNQAITICGHQPATHAVMVGTGKNGSIMDMVITNAANGSYMAMYSHPVGTAADAGSEAAIRSLCAV